MTQGLNSAFYTTAATVIPVFYLALTVQGSMVTGLLRRVNRTIEKMSEAPARKGGRWRHVRPLLVMFSAYGLMIVVVGVLTAGVAGEIAALLALLYGSDSAVTRQLILFSLIGLLLVTAAGPLWMLNTAWVRLQWIPLKLAWGVLRRGRLANQESSGHPLSEGGDHRLPDSETPPDSSPVTDVEAE